MLKAALDAPPQVGGKGPRVIGLSNSFFPSRQLGEAHLGKLDYLLLLCIVLCCDCIVHYFEMPNK